MNCFLLIVVPRSWHLEDIDFDADHVRFRGQADIAERLADVG